MNCPSDSILILPISPDDHKRLILDREGFDNFALNALGSAVLWHRFFGAYGDLYGLVLQRVLIDEEQRLSAQYFRFDSGRLAVVPAGLLNDLADRDSSMALAALVPMYDAPRRESIRATRLR